MTDILRDLLPSHDQIDLAEIDNKLPQLTEITAVYKTEVRDYLDGVHAKFDDRPKHNQRLTARSNQLIYDLTALKAAVESDVQPQLVRAHEDVERTMVMLEKTSCKLAVVEDLCRIHEDLGEIRDLLKARGYFKCMERIKAVEGFNVAAAPPSVDNNDLLLMAPFKDLNVELSTIKSSLLNKLSNLFKDTVILDHTDGKITRISVKITNELNELLPALYLNKTYITPLDNVTKYLWDNIFVPIVNEKIEINLSTVIKDGFNTIEIIREQQQRQSTNDYTEVYSNLKRVLDFLVTNFNYKLNSCDDHLTTLAYIGRDLQDNLSELIIKNCLERTIPTTEDGLKQYDCVIKATKDLQSVLIKSGIFAEDTVSILDYASNIDVLFINKKCQNYMLTSETLMRKDLHSMIEIGYQSDESTSTIIDSNVKYPKSSVSKNVLELLELAESILNQISDEASSDVSAGRLVCTVQNIFRKYPEFVAEYHKKLLQTIPQQIALFHNNCLYLAFRLDEWNSIYSSRIPSVINAGPVMFKDEISQLNRHGTSKFTAYIESQINQIKEILKDSTSLSDNSSKTLENVDSTTEKSIRQCLRQQELLKTVWLKVLPYNTYNQSLGAILDSLCNWLIDAVLKFEDISTAAAEQLIDLFKIIQTRGPKLFSDAHEIGLFAQKSWPKFNELVFVLGASLVDIDDRWADGKGLLALQFKPDELRRLVRALFQNTQRRAALLAKIRD